MWTIPQSSDEQRHPIVRVPLEAKRDAPRGVRTFLLLLLLSGFLVGLWLVLKPFITPLLWSVVISTTTWPAYIRLRKACPKSAPLICTIIVAVLFLLVFLPLPLRLTAELHEFAQTLQKADFNNALVILRDLPTVGPVLAEKVSPFSRNHNHSRLSLNPILPK